MTQVIEAKRTVLTEYKRSPSQKKSQLLSATRNKAQQTARNCANEYWKEISDTIQTAAISGNIRWHQKNNRTCLEQNGPLSSHRLAKYYPIRANRWRDGSYTTQTCTRDRTQLLSQPLTPLHVCQPWMSLMQNQHQKKHSKAIDKLTSGKASGSDGIPRIPSEQVKQCKGTQLIPLYAILRQCWKEGSVPQDMMDADIITPYKNKGERSDCNNCRGISLSWASSVKYLFELSWPHCRSWLTVYI